MMSTPTGSLATPASLMMRGDLPACCAISPKDGLDGAAQAEQAGLAVLGLQPGRIEPVVHGGRAEVPEDRIGAALGQQRPAADLVALPLADLGGGEVADVVDVHHQQRAEVGLLQRLAGARQPVAVQAAIVDALLEIDAHGAEAPAARAPSCSAGRCPPRGSGAWARARMLGHGLPPGGHAAKRGRSVAPGRRSCKRHRAALILGLGWRRCSLEMKLLRLGPG